jgi:AcrR family transcriptional regulator
MKTQNPDIQALVWRKAAEFITNRGVKGWSTVELARETGLAKNTLYKIIGSKENLCERIVLDQIDATTSLLKAIIQDEAGYPAAALRMLEEGPSYLAARPRVTFPEIFLEFPAMEPKALGHQKVAAQAILEFVAQGQREGHIRGDVEPEFLYDLIRGIVEHYTRSGYEGQELSDALLKAFKCLREGVRTGNW